MVSITSLILPSRFEGIPLGSRIFVYFFCLIAVIERVLALEGVLHGNFKGDLQYREFPLVETLLPPVGAARVAISIVSSTAIGEGSITPVDSCSLP